ncbi:MULTISPECIES: glycosyltransferase family 4 protein [Amycolatopsis]|uniref:Glycosyltransferase family 4 protein n=1 Tax=Amycolatopsis dendrobii TaxID=2760662 RepID=A0A7W3ZEG1_9PSEU|nr:MULTISPECIES: glycosyltransferase family 4 protein [Amycolatopsis]MBB1158007.1 glycosyltransferase family 4 protein [Amycolatopsis dendrobii]UKD57196.1 glycosyltransferase family 4 protein [Amycolatopsis sp. FU40]
MTRRRIVQITPYYPPHLGGMEAVVQQLARHQARQHDVTVLTTTVGARDSPRRELVHGVTTVRTPALDIAHTPVSPGLVPALLRTPKTSVWHLHAAHAVLPEQVALAAAARRQPFLLHFHLDVDQSGKLGWLLPHYKRHVFSRVLRAAAGVLVLTEAQREFVRTAYRADPARIFAVPNGVSGEFFLPPRARREPVLRLLFVGRLSPQKNLSRLLHALTRVRQPVVLDVVGDGEQRERLEETAQQQGIPDVRFHGRLHGASLLHRYERADLFVLPSDREGMSLAALEAMAAGLPVLATDVPGNTELLHGIGALAPADPAALAAAIDEFATDEDFRRRTAAASARAARELTWAAVAAQVEDVYAEVLP